MKLYYSPGACSLAVHIVLREMGAKFDLDKVDIPNKKTSDGGDYWLGALFNPKMTPEMREVQLGTIERRF